MMGWRAGLVIACGFVVAGACGGDDSRSDDDDGSSGGTGAGTGTGGAGATGGDGDGGAGAGASDPLAPSFYVQARGSDSQRLEDVRVSPQGRIYFSGSFERGIDLEGTALTASGARDGVVGALDGDGNVLWLGQLAAAVDEWIVGVVLATGGGEDLIVAGHYLGPSVTVGSSSLDEADGAFVARWDSAGVLQSLVSLPCVGPTHVRDAAVGPGGEVIVAGSFQGTCTVNANPVAAINGGSALVMLLDASGTAQWMQAWGGDVDNDGAFGAAFDPMTGDVVIAGHFAGQQDFGGGSETALGAVDMVMLRYDAAGNYLDHQAIDWEVDYPPAVSLDLEITSTRHPVLFGEYSELTLDTPLPSAASATDVVVFVAELDSDFATVFAIRYGGVGGFGGADGLSIAPDDRILLTGRGGTGIDSPYLRSLEASYFVVLSPGGAPVFAANVGSSLGGTHPTAAAIDANGDSVLVGFFNGEADFGLADRVYSQDGFDSFILKRAILE